MARVRGRADRCGGAHARGGHGENEEGGGDTWRLQGFFRNRNSSSSFSRILFGIKTSSTFMKIFVDMGEEHI